MPAISLDQTEVLLGGIVTYTSPSSVAPTTSTATSSSSSIHANPSTADAKQEGTTADQDLMSEPGSWVQDHIEVIVGISVS